MKTNHSFKDSKQRMMALSRSKKLSALLRGTSKRYGHFCYFNFLHSFRIKNKLESHLKVL